MLRLTDCAYHEQMSHKIYLAIAYMRNSKARKRQQRAKRSHARGCFWNGCSTPWRHGQIGRTLRRPPPSKCCGTEQRKGCRSNVLLHAQGRTVAFSASTGKLASPVNVAWNEGSGRVLLRATSTAWRQRSRTHHCWVIVLVEADHLLM